MSVPLEHGNILKHKNGELRSKVAGASRIHVYDFDNSLFYSPLPNPMLFNAESIELLTKNPDPMSKYNWFSNVQILQEVRKNVSGEELWSSILSQLVVNSHKNQDTLTILSVTRIPELFASIILDLLRSVQLDTKFDCILVNEDPNYLDWVISATASSFVGIQEISYYSPTNQLNISGVRCLNIKVPFQTSYLLPQTEVSTVHEMLIGEPFELRRSIFWSFYMLSPDSRQEVLRRTVTEEFIPSEDREELVFEAEGVLIGKNQLSQAKLEELGGLSKKVVLGALSFGSIKGRIYAMRVLINDSNAQSQTYLQPPAIVIARKPDVLLKEVEEITNWEITRDLFRLDAQIEYKQIFKIQSEKSK
ncbi:hypothetical protein OGAPHI_002359 [Ogataea philodendri]|uniref:Swiss Army Knife RNA repair protein HAD domain-containing protein n=1 Tax=Ogataea philodendri TaxID=1378263 RepID=A0A9P8PBN7_9ASCO|nr:uncharacterized protein OGAPHI_002359 [Ogataea philodendri]KAH3668605.1 hypothetical protein OGAPHI_002359 [Ogataea philodendri]